MRASELLGARVVTSDGRDLGVVAGLRCTSDGPKRRGTLPAPRLRGLIVAPHGVGAALGYQQEEQRGPWLIRVVMRRLHRHDRVIEWEDVRRVADGTVRLRAGLDED
jgi:hypothetical protein